MNQPPAPRCGNDPRAQLTDGDRQAVAEFCQHLADRKAATRPAEPLDTILASATQPGWWTMHRPAVETLIARVRELETQLAEMTHCLDNAIRALHRDDIDTGIDVQKTIAAEFYGPGWDWDDHQIERTSRDIAATVRPALAKATQQRDQALDRVRDLEAENTRLADVGRRALVSLDDLIRDHPDPGAEALGARYQLAQTLIGHPHTCSNCDGIDPASCLMGTPQADLTAWAAELAEDGLEPYGGTLTLNGDDQPFVRVHFAFGPEVPPAARESFVTGLGPIILDEL